VHQLDASEHIGGSTKRLEATHWFDHAIDRTMILPDDVVEVLDLAYGDWRSDGSADLVDSGLVGAAFIQRDLFRYAVLKRGLLEEPPDGR
jgi:hypothetical protein